MPAPADEIILRHVLVKLGERTMSVPLGIFELLAHLGERPVFPSHLPRGELPARMPRNAGVWCGERNHIGFMMTCGAIAAGHAHVLGAAHRGGKVQMPILALQRTVARGMAIDATRTLDDSAALPTPRDGP